MNLVETYKEDDLIAGNAHTATVQTVTVASGEGKLKRGSILARNANDKFELLDSNNAGKAEVILAVPVDATSSDAVADVYVSGEFKRGRLIPNSSTLPVGGDIKSLKDAGIYLVNGID